MALVRVDANTPCPICESQGWCSISADGRMCICMRVESESPSKCGGYIHKIGSPIKGLAPPPAPKPKPVVNWGKLARALYRDPKADKKRRELCEELGASIGSLEGLVVGRGYDDYRALEFSSWPEFDHNRNVVGINRRYNEPVTDTGSNKMLFKHSSHGVYCCRNWWMYGGPILLVEGGSDTAICYSMGISAIGRPNCLGGIQIIKDLLYQYRGFMASVEKKPAVAIAIGENDWRIPDVQHDDQCQCCMKCFPGRHGAMETARKTGALCAMTPNGAKDVRVWVQENGLDRIEFILQMRKEWKKQ